MNISVKDVILSFAVGLVVFSLLMLVICVGIFKSDISVETLSSVLDEKSEPLNIDKSVIFAVQQNNGTDLKIAVLALFDKKENELALTPIYGDYLMNYQDSLSYVSGVFSKEGKAALCELVKSISGISVEVSDVITFNGPINFSEFKSKLSAEIAEEPQKYADVFDNTVDFALTKFRDVPLVVTEQITESTHQHISIIDVDSSIDMFDNLIS